MDVRLPYHREKHLRRAFEYQRGATSTRHTLAAAGNVTDASDITRGITKLADRDPQNRAEAALRCIEGTACAPFAETMARRFLNFVR